MAYAKVWYREWSWACCGLPLAVGDEITLAISPVNLATLEPMAIRRLDITFVDNVHDDIGESVERSGRVVSIRQVQASEGTFITTRVFRLPATTAATAAPVIAFIVELDFGR